MKNALLVRDESTDAGTFGKLTADRGFECYTGELPWRKNVGGLSCIPTGIYVLEWAESPSRRLANGNPEWTYRFKKVDGRSGVLIHSGNFCGDRDKFYATDVEGCIILGRAVMPVEISVAKRAHQPWIAPDRLTQMGVSSSKDTVAAFVAHMGKAPFQLEIR